MSFLSSFPVKRVAWLLAASLTCWVNSGFSAYPPNWDRAGALAAAQTVASDEVQRELMDLTIAGSTVNLLNLLVNTGSRPDWPAPARESVLYGYAQELRKLPANTVPSEAMTFLKSYQATTLVPHEDHAYAGVPLFNIRAAAIGVENGWLREAALLEGLALMAANPRALVDVFLIETHPAARGGYLDTLVQASPDQLQGVCKSAVRRLGRYTELTPLAGRAALLSGDLDALAEVFILGGGPGLAPLMRDSSMRLGSPDSALLMGAVIEQAPLENAALAIAELGPVAVQLVSARALLLDRLGDPGLGAPAAMVLARHGTADTLQALEALATDGSSLASTRARMALEMGGRDAEQAAQP